MQRLGGGMMSGPQELSKEHADLAAEVLAGGSITADDVLTLRRITFHDGGIDRAEAELLFHLDASSADNAPEWNDYFVEALTDHLLRSRLPEGVLSEADGEFLIDRVTHDGDIDSATEFALLVNIIHRANSSPDIVSALALEVVKQSVMEDGGVVLGPERHRPGVIDEAEVELIRKVIYGIGGGGGFTVGRDEAELLFALNNATTEKQNVAGWQDLFVKGVTNYLMFPRGPQKMLTVEEAAQREAWLNERRGVSGLLGATLTSLARREGVGGGVRVGDVMKQDEVAQAEREFRERQAAVEARAREAIDEPEAAWLIEHLMADDVLHENERALLAHIKSIASDIHLSLDPYFEKYGV